MGSLGDSVLQHHRKLQDALRDILRDSEQAQADLEKLLLNGAGSAETPRAAVESRGERPRQRPSGAAS